MSSAITTKKDINGQMSTEYIFEQKRIEKAFLKSENIFKNLVNKMNEGLIYVNNDDVIQFVNPRLCKIVGYTKNELIGKVAHKLFFNKSSKYISKRMLKEKEKEIGKSRIFEMQLKRKDNDIIWVHNSISPFYNDNGVIIGFVGIIEDISRRKRAEMALLESEEHLQTITKNIPSIVVEIDRKGKIFYINRLVENITIKDVIGKTIYGFIKKEYIKETEQKVKDVFESSIVEHFELKGIDNYGETKWYAITITPVINNGMIKRAIVIVKDITRRKDADRKIADNQRFIERMADASPNILFIYDIIEHKNVYINRKIEDVLGYTVKKINKMAGKTFLLDILHPDDHHLYTGISKRYESIKDGELLENIYRLKDANGQWRWFKNRASIFSKDSNGKPKEIIGTSEDITESKKVEEEVIKSREQLRNLSSHLQSVIEGERKQIAREIHDELGQALTAIKLELSLCSNKFPDTLENRRVINSKMPSILNLIDNTIKTVRKISTELHPSILDNLGLIPALEWQVEEFTRRTKINCQASFFIDKLLLNKDLSTAIFRIFQESLTNIARHSKAKKVNISLNKKRDKLILNIKDNGIGLSEKDILNQKSFGLIGMTERVKNFGGSMSINGIKGEGTSIKIEFPVYFKPN